MMQQLLQQLKAVHVIQSMHTQYNLNSSNNINLLLLLVFDGSFIGT